MAPPTAALNLPTLTEDERNAMLTHAVQVLTARGIPEDVAVDIAVDLVAGCPTIVQRGPRG